MNRFVVISGCSGGGKSSLLQELARRGHAVVPEPGRRIVREERAGDGSALPWRNMAAFARRAVAMALDDRALAPRGGEWVFFDRGLIDAAVALQHVAGDPAVEDLGSVHRYHRRVFLAPPWPEIYRTDVDRPHGIEDAVAEYERLIEAYRALGYEALTIPKVTVAERADFVLDTLGDGDD